MAKRMTDTEKWEDDWFVALTPKYKLFWLFLCDRCDHAGVWKVAPSVAGALIGEAVNLEEALAAFGPERIQVGEGFWWVKKFCEFQYGPVLDPLNKVHKSAIAILNSRGLQAPTKPLPSPYQGDKDKDKDKNKDLELSDFEQFWKAYPNKKAKQDAIKAWGQVKPDLQATLKALSWQRRQEQWTKDKGAFIPLPASWLRGKRWEDEPPYEKQAFKLPPNVVLPKFNLPSF